MNIKLSKNGSTIKIKKSNKGKFTEYCEGKVTDECISRAKKSKSLKIRKRAIFADNARTWKHQFGGTIEVKGNAETYNKIAGIGSTVLSTVGNAITAGKTQSAMNKANELNRQLDSQQQLLDISTANAEALNLQQNSANSSYTNGIYKDIYNLQQQIQLNYNNPSVVRQLTNQLNAKQNLLNNQITLAGTTDTTAQQKLVDNLKGQTQNAYQDVQSSSESENLFNTVGSLMSNISFKNKAASTNIKAFSNMLDQQAKTFNQKMNNIVDQSRNMLQIKGILPKYSTLDTPKFEITQPSFTSKTSSFNLGGI